MTKTCFKCQQTLDLSEFYPHPQMADGHLNKCKECARCDAMQIRRKKVDYYREYDRARSGLPHRISKCKAVSRQRNAEHPERAKATSKARRAFLAGRIQREPCHFCGSTENLEMHHPDYSQPLRIYWLCRTCHRKLDSMTKRGIIKIA